MGKYKKIFSLILILVSIGLLSLMAKTDRDTVYFLSTTLVAFIKVLGFLIIPLSQFVKINKSYIYLCMYIGGCGVFGIINAVLSSMRIGISSEEKLFLSFMVSIMEIIAIYHVVSAEESDCDNKEIIINVFSFVAIFLFVTTIVLAIPYLNRVFNYNGLTVILQVQEFIFIFRGVLQVLIVFLFISLIIAINLYCKNIYYLPMKNDIIKFIIVRIFHSSLYLVSYTNLVYFYLNTFIVVLTGYYIGKIFFICIIKNPNETLYLNLKLKNRDLEKALTYLEEYSEIIEEENNHINNIINSFPEAVCIIEDNKISSANTRFREIFQCYHEEDYIGRTFVDLVREDYEEQYYNRIRELETKMRNEEIEYVLEFNGVGFIGEVVTSKIIKGSKYILVCVIRDVTKKRLIAQLNNTLEYKERENMVRSELLTNISHEFKTPVHVIYSAIQMQEVYSANEDYKNMMKFNNVIKQNCFRLIRLINNFIDITRFEANVEVKSNIKTLNIVQLVEDTVESVVSYCSENNISIIFDTENEEIYGEFDRDMMDRIMLNLLSNAIKYNVKNGCIFVNINETENEVTISVKDTGVGISKEDLEKLFHRFERLDKTLSRKREGTGIGLNIVKSLVEYQQGRIEVSSELGQGTTFSLIFLKKEVDFDTISYYQTPKDELISKVTLELSDII